MSFLDIAASPPIRRDETVRISLLLAFTGSYLAAYTWIVHGVMANAQTANIVLLAIFVKVEGVIYSSAMITGNLRQAIEGLFAAVSNGCQLGTLRRSGIFVTLCVAFGTGAAVRAYATKGIPDVALGLPVVAPPIVLRCCELQRNEQHI
jgi:uncharacterized membrane protein YoaK (UPF0700 family)